MVTHRLAQLLLLFLLPVKRSLSGTLTPKHRIHVRERPSTGASMPDHNSI